MYHEAYTAQLCFTGCLLETTGVPVTRGPPIYKGSDWIRLVFAHQFPSNNKALSDGKVQVYPYLAIPLDFGSKIQYGVASSYTLMMELAQPMGAPLFMASGWAQSTPYLVSPFMSQFN